VVPVVLAALVLVALSVHLPWFGDALYGDEVHAFWDISGRRLDDTLHLLAGNSTVLSRRCSSCSRGSASACRSVRAVVRVVSLAAGLATIPLTYVLGRATLGARAGLPGGAFVALSPSMGFYSCRARPYALMAMLCVVSPLELLRRGARRRQEVVGARRRSSP
jgi:hypothetical protein